MAFQVPNTLLVTVYGANNLSPRDTNGSADPFVKIAIPGCDKVFQTQVRLLLDFSLTVKAATLIFISGRGSAISSAK